MVIYYAMTKYHLIFSLTHKLKNYGQQHAVLFLYSGLQGIEEEHEKILETQIFNQVYIVPEIQLRKSWVPLKEGYTSADIEHNVSKMVEDIETWLPITLSREDTIYLANDHWALGTYCIYNKIPYHYYEDGVGMLSKPDYSYQLVKKMNVTHAITAKYVGAFGLNSCVIEKLGDLSNQSEGFYDEKAVHFSLKDELKALSEIDRNNILYIFDAPQLKGKEGVTLLLTEHFVNMKRLSIEGQREIYTMLVDLFGNSRYLCIKPHPNDFQINYQQVFPEAEMISRFFPSELLPYCFDTKLQLALAACSTSVYGLQDIANNILRFDIDIENHYMYLLKYWVCAMVVKTLHPDSVKCVNTYDDLVVGIGLDIHQKEKAERIIYIIDDKQEQDMKMPIMNKQDVMIYVNSKKMYTAFFEHEMELKNLCIIRIHKEINDINYIQNKCDEYIWIYSQDRKSVQTIKKFHKRREMKHMGMMLDVDCITDNNEIKIKILEGNLNASLERIAKYKEQEREHLQTIEKLQKQLKQNDKEILTLLEKTLKQRHEEEE